MFSINTPYCNSILASCYKLVRINWIHYKINNFIIKTFKYFKLLLNECESLRVSHEHSNHQNYRSHLDRASSSNCSVYCYSLLNFRSCATTFLKMKKPLNSRAVQVVQCLALSAYNRELQTSSKLSSTKYLLRDFAGRKLFRNSSLSKKWQTIQSHECCLDYMFKDP